MYSLDIAFQQSMATPLETGGPPQAETPAKLPYSLTPNTPVSSETKHADTTTGMMGSMPKGILKERKTVEVRSDGPSPTPATKIVSFKTELEDYEKSTESKAAMDAQVGE
jgi:hypothetical protein